MSFLYRTLIRINLHEWLRNWGMSLSANLAHGGSLASILP